MTTKTEWELRLPPCYNKAPQHLTSKEIESLRKKKKKKDIKKNQIKNLEVKIELKNLELNIQITGWTQQSIEGQRKESPGRQNNRNDPI